MTLTVDEATKKFVDAIVAQSKIELEVWARELAQAILEEANRNAKRAVDTMVHASSRRHLTQGDYLSDSTD